MSEIKKLEIEKFQTPAVMKLKQIMEDAGHEIRIVGGAVRDLVLGKEPKDIDMATDATPDEMIKIFLRADIRYEPTGLHHGTLTIIIDGEIFEITTLRTDKETDGRHAIVEFTRNWKTDAERRDLTYNAMSVDLNGNLYDYFNGVDDLRAGRSKFVGDTATRIEEDYLRILRYFRFQCQLDNPHWDSDTIKIIREKTPNLVKISGERIWAEMSKILKSQKVYPCMRYMYETDVLDYISLSLSFDDVTKVLTFRKVSNDPIIILASLIGDLDKLAVIKERWKISNEEYKLINFLLSNKDTTLDNLFIRAGLSRGYPRRYFSALALFKGNKVLSEFAETCEIPLFPVTGKDLFSIGMNQGPDMGRALDLMRDKWEKSNFTLDKSQLLAII